MRQFVVESSAPCVQMAVDAWSQMTDEQKRKYSEEFKQNHTIEELDADGDVDVVNEDGVLGGKRKCGPLH